MTENSEARKRHEERQANCVCDPVEHIRASQPANDALLAHWKSHPDYDSVITVEISVEDAWQLDRLFVPSGEMTVPAEARLIAAIRHELAKVGK